MISCASTTGRHTATAAPVGFGPHRLMLRPRGTRELRLTAFELTTTPQARAADP